MQTYKFNLKALEELSLRKGLSLAKLCEKAGMSRSRVADWKRREVNPKTVFRIAQVLGADPMDLIVKEDNQ